MKGTVNLIIEGYACALNYRFYPADNDWDVTRGCYIDSGFQMCRSTLDILTRRCREDIDAAIRRDLLNFKKAA